MDPVLTTDGHEFRAEVGVVSIDNRRQDSVP